MCILIQFYFHCTSFEKRYRMKVDPNPIYILILWYIACTLLFFCRVSPNKRPGAEPRGGELRVGSVRAGSLKVVKLQLAAVAGERLQQRTLSVIWVHGTLLQRHESHWPTRERADEGFVEPGGNEWEEKSEYWWPRSKVDHMFKLFRKQTW